MGLKLGELEVSPKVCLVRMCRKGLMMKKPLALMTLGGVFALMECTADVSIKDVDFMVWEGDA